MTKLAAALLVSCVSCAPLVRVEGGAPPERLRFAPAGYYEDEPRAGKLAGAAVLTCGVIVGFVCAWPYLENLFSENASTWFYGY